MARINTNVSSLIAQTNLAKSNRSLEGQLQRLATGLRINRGADDPAGLIVSERLRSELRGIGQGIKNSERASSVIATAEGALAEVSELLNSIKALTVEAANTGAVSPEEIAAISYDGLPDDSGIYTPLAPPLDGQRLTHRMQEFLPRLCGWYLQRGF